MKQFFLFLILIGMLLLNSCNNDRLLIDISGIDLDLKVMRLDQAFLPLDTVNPEFSRSLNAEFTGFYNFYLDTILGAGGVKNSQAISFLAKDPIYPLIEEVQEGIEAMNPEINHELELLKDGFKHLLYYFPEAEIPEVVCYNSWFQYGTLSYRNFLGVGLDFFVEDSALQRKYPPQFYGYMKQDMTPDLIATSALYAHIANVVYPETSNEQALIDHMILKGKQRYLLEAMFPELKEHLIMSYTEEELSWCYRKEMAVWKELSKVQDNNSTLLFSDSKSDIRRWIQPGPFTSALSEEATDRMGEWIGLQMVRDYMRENPEVSVPDMLKKAPAQIMKFYNPKH